MPTHKNVGTCLWNRGLIHSSEIKTIENCATWSTLMFSSQLATMVFSEHKVETYWLLMLCCTSQLIWYSLLIAYVILATQSIYEICMRVALLLQQTLWFNYSLSYSALHMVKWNLPEINQSKNSTCMLASFFFVLQLSQWYTAWGMQWSIPEVM